MEGGLLGFRTGAGTSLAINILTSFERFVGFILDGVLFLKEKLVFFERAVFPEELALFEELVCLRLIIGRISADIPRLALSISGARTAVKEIR